MPVILVFTKFESLDAEVFNQLQTSSEYSVEDAIKQASHIAQKNFEKAHLAQFTNGRKYPPKNILFLKSIIYYKCYI